MKQIVKRILTFALSAAMVLTLVPTTAFAEDTGSNNVNKNLRVLQVKITPKCEVHRDSPCISGKCL